MAYKKDHTWQKNTISLAKCDLCCTSPIALYRKVRANWIQVIALNPAEREPGRSRSQKIVAIRRQAPKLRRLLIIKLTGRGWSVHSRPISPVQARTISGKATLLVAAAAALMCLSFVGVRTVLASSSGVDTTATSEEASAAGAEVTAVADGGAAIVVAEGEVVPASRRHLATACTAYTGYIAYRDIDRDGDDIGNYGSASSALAACNRNPSCVAFNSQGWAKRSATPAMPYGGLCLWVKRSSMGAYSGACAGGPPAQPTQFYPGSAIQALTDLVQDYCYSNSGAKCDEIDFMGTTNWYQEYFYDFPSLSNNTCNTQMVLTPASDAPRAASRSVLTCRPNPTSEGVCTFSPRLETASSVAVTQARGYSDQFKAGVVTKVTATFGAMEATMESTFDFAFR
ncbi:hypothetical protein VOLCADRAFT_106367 [Volvox carteri f. nagariensis]|uniref:Uncharacterized protein n=1 Tax=Volvox carteri f. nagariensis TaxID=3068 RepID=D8U6X5_VOLCA|nr:uncharacterized protein VOLCADRAFT_106367 [Volvox carteri f. nagariensis]EFJ44590.1 hypothetical protein VOLCADRAFT_106367 [Volvox carteri f. nagariensis]|eukprot:XP_002954440.1 hypothetical protein VOLCADRAFT_106367 [Volvox carteri f. nagariensis]